MRALPRARRSARVLRSGEDVDAPALCRLEPSSRWSSSRTSRRASALGDDLKVAPRQIQVWFQNRQHAYACRRSPAPSARLARDRRSSGSRTRLVLAEQLVRRAGARAVQLVRRAAADAAVDDDAGRRRSRRFFRRRRPRSTPPWSRRTRTSRRRSWRGATARTRRPRAARTRATKPAIPLAPLPPLPFGARSMTPTDGTGVASAASSETCSLPSPAQRGARAPAAAVRRRRLGPHHRPRPPRRRRRPRLGRRRE